MKCLCIPVRTHGISIKRNKALTLCTCTKAAVRYNTFAVEVDYYINLSMSPVISVIKCYYLSLQMHRSPAVCLESVSEGALVQIRRSVQDKHIFRQREF